MVGARAADQKQSHEGKEGLLRRVILSTAEGLAMPQGRTEKPGATAGSLNIFIAPLTMNRKEDASAVLVPLQFWNGSLT